MAFVLAAGLAGCASTQSSIVSLSSYKKQLVVGETTKAEVLAALGEPTKTAPGRNGGEVLTWVSHRAETRDASGSTQDPWQDGRGGKFSYVVQRPTTLSIQFSDAGTVTNYQFLEP